MNEQMNTWENGACRISILEFVDVFLANIGKLL